MEMPSGPRMKQMRTPGRIVVGSRVKVTPFGLDLGRDGVDVLHRET
ncbi:hypothetical protein ACVWW3_003112 [Bradyrhizobium sp. LM2.9]